MKLLKWDQNLTWTPHTVVDGNRSSVSHLADKPTSAYRNEQGHQQVNPATTARGLTSPARLFSFVSFVVFTCCQLSFRK